GHVGGGSARRRPASDGAPATVCFAQLCGGTAVVVSKTRRSGDGGNFFLSQSAASVSETGAADEAAAAAAFSFASNAASDAGSLARSRVCAAGWIAGLSN